MPKDFRIPAGKAKYENWEMPDLTGVQRSINKRLEEIEQEEETHSVETLEAYNPPTLEELEQLRADFEAEGKAEGLAKGLEEGREAGFEEGKKQGYEEAYQTGYNEGLANAREVVEAEILKWQNLQEQIVQPLSAIDEDVELAIVELIKLIATGVLRRELNLGRSELRDIVREAIKSLPISSDRVFLRVNPEDAQIVESACVKSLEDYKIVVDENITKGGCILEMKNSLVNSTVERRYQALVDMIIGEAYPETYLSGSNSSQALGSGSFSNQNALQELQKLQSELQSTDFKSLVHQSLNSEFDRNGLNKKQEFRGKEAQAPLPFSSSDFSNSETSFQEVDQETYQEVEQETNQEFYAQPQVADYAQPAHYAQPIQQDFVQQEQIQQEQAQQKAEIAQEAPRQTYATEQAPFAFSQAEQDFSQVEQNSYKNQPSAQDDFANSEVYSEAENYLQPQEQQNQQEPQATQQRQEEQAPVAFGGDDDLVDLNLYESQTSNYDFEQQEVQQANQQASQQKVRYEEQDLAEQQRELEHQEMERRAQELRAKRQAQQEQQAQQTQQNQAGQNQAHRQAQELDNQTQSSRGKYRKDAQAPLTFSEDAQQIQRASIDDLEIDQNTVSNWLDGEENLSNLVAEEKKSRLNVMQFPADKSKTETKSSASSVVEGSYLETNLEKNLESEINDLSIDDDLVDLSAFDDD